MSAAETLDGIERRALSAQRAMLNAPEVPPTVGLEEQPFDSVFATESDSRSSLIYVFWGRGDASKKSGKRENIVFLIFHFFHPFPFFVERGIPFSFFNLILVFSSLIIVCRIDVDNNCQAIRTRSRIVQENSFNIFFRNLRIF